MAPDLGGDAKSEVLKRIRTALADRAVPMPVPRGYRSAGSVTTEHAVLVAQFDERVADYRATVHRASAGASVESILAGRGIARVVVPDGFPDALLPTSVEAVREPVDTAVLDAVSAVVTTCAAGVAETGTIVLDAGPGMGPRALTLVPDYHLVVIRTDQILAIVPDAVAALDGTRPLTWISGPSATSDIELNRVEGVHGPRTLDVLITD